MRRPPPRRGTSRRAVRARAGTGALALVLGLLAGLGAPSASAATPRERQVRTVPSRIPSDCSRDVTADLLRWITSVRANSVLSFVEDGCYRIDGTLQITNRRNLTFDGNGSTFRAGTDGNQGRRHLLFVGGGGFVIRDLTVRGAVPEATAVFPEYVAQRAFQHAFAFQGVQGATLDRVTATGVHGDFVYVGAAADGTWSRRIRIRRSEFTGSGRQGISVVAGEDVRIHRNSIRGVARSMFDLEPNTGGDGARDVRITDNRTGAAGNFWLASKGDGRGPVESVVVSGNRADGATGNLFWVQGGFTRGPFLIEDNAFMLRGTVHDESSRAAFFFSRCADVTIRDNRATFPEGTALPAVEIRSSQRVTVVDNRFPNVGELTIDTTPAP